LTINKAKQDRAFVAHRFLSQEPINDGECRQAAKVAIGSPQLANAMITADRGTLP